MLRGEFLFQSRPALSGLPLPQRVGFLGNYPPRRCGIATFTQDLCEAVSASVTDCYVAAVNDQPGGYDYPPRVRLESEQKDIDSYRRGADFLNFNSVDVLSVQHEFGIYGGAAGGHLLALLKEVRMPVVTTLHTVLKDPNPVQRRVMEEIVARSDRLVVMAHKGLAILEETYGVPGHKIDVIPHGIPDLAFIDSRYYKPQFGVEGRKVLLTFGLIGPGKGIEDVITALPAIIRRHPEVVYLVLGATHPHLVAHEGERYRLGLERLAEDLGVTEHIIFYNRFVSLADLKEFIGATDIYLTPYVNESQITSGALSYVFGAGKAVVSTPYWHAQELLADGRGVLVPFRDPQAIAAGVGDLLDDAPRLERMRREAYEAGRGMIWSAVAQRYLKSFHLALADREARPRAAFAGWTLGNRPYALPPMRIDHISRMSDGTGIFQHATFNVPNYHEGYCTDDNARAYILMTLWDEIAGLPPEEARARLSSTYLAFLAAAFDRQSGRFRNFMSHGRQWLENQGSEDSHGRALWAAGTGAGRSRNDGHRRLAGQLFLLGLPAVEEFTSPRAWSFALLGIHEFLRSAPDDPTVLAARKRLAARLVGLWQDTATEDWPWFETVVSYDNARLCQCLLLCGRWIPDPQILEIGLRSLRWLVSIQKTQSGCFRPVGSNGFYQCGGARADFDQQPVEALAMISACHEAFHATQDAIWTREARRAFEWFLGRNDLGLMLYDFGTGGCGDGLHPDRVNENQGAESTLAFQMALAEMVFAEHPFPPT